LRPYAPARTPWGDPDLQGAYTNSNESLIPMERPASLTGRTLESITPEELARLNEERNQSRIEADKQRWELRSPLHWFENHDPKASRAWLVIDPPDGRIPATTPEAKQRATARTQARQGRGDADSYEDRSLYDRCITRGLPGSMMPAIYGNAYEIIQGPGYVAISYEMVNELRVIPLDPSTGSGSPRAQSRGGGRPHVSPAIRMYMGDSRGRWEGDTLVVETTNFTDKVAIGSNGAGYPGDPGYHSLALRVVERFTRTSDTVLTYEVTVDDPQTWVKPWTLRIPLMRGSDPHLFEYACHEGNYAMRNILSASRSEDKK